jgi:hypothetical protein
MSTDYVFDLDETDDIEKDIYFIKNHVFYWKRPEWGYFYPLNDIDNEFIATIEGNDTIKMEQLRVRDISWIITFEYKLLNGQWKLIYYSNELY